MPKLGFLLVEDVMFYAYAIKSASNERIYIGQTNNINKRIESHNKGYVRSTKRDRPWCLLSFEEFETRENARWQERELKKSLGKCMKWIEAYRV